MKINIQIILLVLLSIHITQSLQAKTENNVCDTFTDSEWILCFADSLERNAEVTEMRNEYLFCRLESDSAESFVQFLYSAVNKKNRKSIERELQMPIHDDININRCLYNVSKSRINPRFKKWMIAQLKQAFMKQYPKVNGPENSIYYPPRPLGYSGDPDTALRSIGAPKAQYAVLGRGGRTKRLKPQSGFL